MKNTILLVLAFMLFGGQSFGELRTIATNGCVVTYNSALKGEAAVPNLSEVPVITSTNLVQFTFISDGVWSNRQVVALSLSYGNYFKTNANGSIHLEYSVTNIASPNWQGFSGGGYLGTVYGTNNNLTHFIDHLTNGTTAYYYRLGTP